MAFESLTTRLTGALKKITGQGKLTEKNMEDMLKEVRMSLLEADVNYKVVKDFINSIKEKALGEEVLSALKPDQMVLKIVREELVKLLGSEQADINYNNNGLTSVMMVGLQGSGKTTASAKIAYLLKRKKAKKVLLAACDIIRPAAIEQLKTLGQSIDVEVYSEGVEVDAVTTAKHAYEYALNNGFDLVLFDTAGRLHIDEALMQELEEIKQIVKPHEILLTVDAMTGQDIVNVAEGFNNQLHVTGLVVTKLDGDARGGGVLSVKAMSGVPVKFCGIGEKVEDLDIFYPDRMADRILGMGDLLTLIEQAEEKMDKEASERSGKRLLSGKFDLNDMMVQFDQISRMGSMKKLLKMIPGMGQLAEQVDEAQADGQMTKIKAMLSSMTNYERENPSCIQASRKQRIAKGSGTSVGDVNKLLTQYNQMQKMMQAMNQMQKGGMPNMQMMKKMQQQAAMGKRVKGGGGKFQSKLKKRR